MTTRLETVYCTDEDVAIRATGDFQALCPDWQSLAQGTDGAVLAGIPWVLTSSTANFGAQGVRPGHVAVLTGPRGTPAATVFRGSGEMLAVDSVDAYSVTLRRLGQDTGLGQPLTPTTGISFLIATLDPQIEEASFALNRQFAIDPLIAGRMPTELYDLREMRQACVLTVLRARYQSETRTGQGEFSLKLKVIMQDLNDVIGRLNVRWMIAGAAGPTSETNWFSTRIVR